MKKSLSAITATALLSGLVAAASGCSTPGAQSPEEHSTETGSTSIAVEAPITPEQIAELGQTTLTVWADQGEQEFMDKFIPEFEGKYTNVTVNISYKSFNDLTATVLNAMNSDNAPDVTQGNQGWATDGALVKAQLIRPLDDLATAYDYFEAAGDASTQLQWSDDGSTFGVGKLYGMSPDNQMVGIFSNNEKLESLGLEVPSTLEDMDAVLGKLKEAGETPIMMGNADKAGAMQALSIIQGALAPANDTRDWITGKAKSTFDSANNQAAIDTFAGWVNKGYIVDGYDGISPDDAAARFSHGEGTFFIGGNWYASTIAQDNTYTFSPGFLEGQYASSGSFGLPWHISSKTDSELAALAFVGSLNSKETAPLLAEVQRVPIFPITASKTSPMMSDLLEASQQQLSNAGALYWYDWATDTMFDTFSSALQERLADQIDSAEFIKRVQTNWDSFHK